MKAEIAAWMLAAVAALWVQSGFRIQTSNDSYQYLSVAAHLRAGEGIQTSIAHFHTERSYGTIPAPMTWFPAGYRAAIALASGVTRGDLEAAAQLVCLMSGRAADSGAAADGQFLVWGVQ